MSPIVAFVVYVVGFVLAVVVALRVWRTKRSRSMGLGGLALALLTLVPLTGAVVGASLLVLLALGAMFASKQPAHRWSRRTSLGFAVLVLAAAWPLLRFGSAGVDEEVFNQTGSFDALTASSLLIAAGRMLLIAVGVELAAPVRAVDDAREA